MSFRLAAGDVLSLLGPSGSGKTTLLRVVAGLEPIEQGAIFFRGRDLAGVQPHRRKIGMMFQEYALFPHQTVWQNVAFGLEMQRVSAAEISRRVDEMLAVVGLAGFGRRRVDQLSGGERQRVALARSLAPNPQLLLLDEPLGSLDRILRDRLAGEIRAILKSLGVTAIFVTHDQAEAFSVADKVAVLDGGVLHQFDTPEGLYRRPASRRVARFLGFENFIAAEADGEGVLHVANRQLEILLHQATTNPRPGRCTMLIRPDGATISEGGTTRSDACTLNGLVRHCRFIGGGYRLTLDVDDLQLSFDLPIDPTPPQPGRQVGLCLKPGSIVVLPEEP